MIAAALFVVWGSLSTARDSLYGTVRVAGTGEVVPGVRVSAPGTTAVSDSAGWYVLYDVHGPRLDVRFERLGFKALTVSVMRADGGNARVDVDLASAPVPLLPVAVVPEPPDPGWTSSDSAEIGHVRLTSALARRNPLVGASDVFEALATAAFITGRDELAPSLRVRGGAGGENLVLLDGLPWHGPRPLAGIAGVLPNGAVAAVDIHTAVPPARFGDALSSTIVVHSRAADQLTLDGSLDPTTVEQTVGSPLPLHGATILFSGRKTYRSVFGQADETGEGANGFSDVFGRLSLAAAGGRLDLYRLLSRDRLTFSATTQPSSDSGLGSPAPPNRFTSSGSLAGAVWGRSVGAGRTASARLWYSGSTADVVWGVRSAASRLRDIGVSADYTSDRTEVGLTLSRTAASYRVQDSTAPGLVLDGAPAVAAAFATQRWTLTPGWTLSTGVRLGVTPTWGAQVEPRVWTRVAIGDRIAASFGYARLHQYVQSARNEESMMDAVLGADLPVAAGASGLPPARSDQVTGVIEARLGTGSTVLVEAYTRSLSGIGVVPAATRLPLLDGAIPLGRGSVWGGDATLTYQDRHVDVRAQVGVLSAYRIAGAIRYRPSDAQERLSVGVGYRLSRQTVVRCAVRVESGRPTTLLQDRIQFEPFAPLAGAGEVAGTPSAVPGPLNTSRLPTYVRADLGIGREWELGGGGAWISTALTVTNLFNRSNVLASMVTPDGLQPVFLASRAVSLRVQWALPH